MRCLVVEFIVEPQRRPARRVEGRFGVSLRAALYCRLIPLARGRAAELGRQPSSSCTPSTIRKPIDKDSHKRSGLRAPASELGYPMGTRSCLDYSSATACATRESERRKL